MFLSHTQDAVIETCNARPPKIDDSILIVGGFDGSSWLSALGSYSPSRDTMKSLRSMIFVRSYASAAILNGELYIFGGRDRDIWHDTVESYNAISDQWVSHPLLNQRKRSLAGASLYNKIFAVGGGNEVECYSEVEMLDMNIGRWITSQSMQQSIFMSNSQQSILPFL
ncbi:Kelch-like protein 2 [Camellia lanceoleosa]|uniref:Kelch-like protein 2 n=1 Tax=Camellia lanceoleosa TaxID=1840588 RepID=A0ACC0FR73_9ERIC|nr:Kelch-like protein 2 [Camellia lanceoleosa]